MHYKFHKVYIEITNICGLECSFCPTKIDQPRTMSLELFESILKEVKSYTSDIALHVFGDPLVVSNLGEYLNLAFKYKLAVHLTTTGYYLNKINLDHLLHPSIKQINFSLNSFNKNTMNMSLEEYLEPMILLSQLKIKSNNNFFINFRLWNIDKENSEDKFNSEVFDYLGKVFKIVLNQKNCDSIRLDNKVLIHFDNYFQWPSLSNSNDTDGFCYGLKSQLAILSNGTVVPCCLDHQGIINLGDIKTTSLNEILGSERSKNIVNGFAQNIAKEELCKKCTYKHRFDIISK